MAVPQDLTDMVKARLQEFQSPVMFMSPRGKAYLMVVGGVMAHQAGGLVDYPLSE
jgi:hypothetical protein